MPLVEIHELSVHYGAIKALDGISLEAEGGAIGLLGPNGAGKSTLMKTLLGYRRFRAGAVRVCGHALPGDTLRIRQRVGYMPETEVNAPRVSAVGFVAFCGQLCGMGRVDAMQRTHDLLNYVGLGESRYRKMETYSTGMLQRVKLAQALIHDPKLLLLDEPTNGLDPEGRIEMLDLIRDITQRREVTVLLSTHLLREVERVCDRVVQLEQGRIVRDARMDELLEAIPNCYTVGVLGPAPAFVEALQGAGAACQPASGGAYMLTLPEGMPHGAVFATARDLGAQIRQFTPVRRRLETLFLAPDKDA